MKTYHENPNLTILDLIEAMGGDLHLFAVDDKDFVYEEVIGLFPQLIGTREDYVDFIEDYKDNIFKAEQWLRTAKLVMKRNNTVCPVVQSHYHRLSNRLKPVTTMYLALRAAARVWRREAIKEKRKELEVV